MQGCESEQDTTSVNSDVNPAWTQKLTATQKVDFSPYY